MLTRKDYLNQCNKDTRHRLFDEFFSQFITPAIVAQAKPIAKDIAKCNNRIDSALNEYKNLDYWENLAVHTLQRMNSIAYKSAYEKNDNDVYTSDALCTLKLAVTKQLLEMGYSESLEYDKYGFQTFYLTKGE